MSTLVRLIQKYRPIIVGGQAISLWSHLYEGADSELDGLEVTSKDLDFYHNKDAEIALAESLEEGKLKVPTGDDHTPCAAVVTGKLGNRTVVVDFLSQVKGVTDESLLKNSITYGDPEDPEGLFITLMHPVDCVRSRLSNINILRRHDAHSVKQAIASIRILDCFVEDQLSQNSDLGRRNALDALRALEKIIEKQHIGRTTDTVFGLALRPDRILEKYVNDTRLDERVRLRLIFPSMERLKKRRKIANERTQRCKIAKTS